MVIHKVRELFRIVWRTLLLVKIEANPTSRQVFLKWHQQRQQINASNSRLIKNGLIEDILQEIQTDEA
jgi:hypothetical protein